MRPVNVAVQEGVNMLLSSAAGRGSVFSKDLVNLCAFGIPITHETNVSISTQRPSNVIREYRVPESKANIAVIYNDISQRAGPRKREFETDGRSTVTREAQGYAKYLTSSNLHLSSSWNSSTNGIQL